MNGPNTHGEFIALPSGGSAFVDGVPDNCDHDYSGDWVYITASGKVIYWHTYRQWASYTEQMRGPLIHQHQDSIGDPVTGGAVSCRKCKKIYQPSIHEI